MSSVMVSAEYITQTTFNGVPERTIRHPYLLLELSEFLFQQFFKRCHSEQREESLRSPFAPSPSNSSFKRRHSERRVRALLGARAIKRRISLKCYPPAHAPQLLTGEKHLQPLPSARSNTIIVNR